MIVGMIATTPTQKLYKQFVLFSAILSHVTSCHPHIITRRMHSIVASEWLTQGHAMHNTLYEFVL